MPRFNHAFDIAFEVISNKEDGDDITPAQFREAIKKRIEGIDDRELLEAIGAPFDTHIEGE